MGNFSADLNDIIDAIGNATITAGKIKQIPFGVGNGVSFTYNSEVVVLSAIYLNKSSQTYYMDMKWNSGQNAIYGIPIKSGINILEQFTNCPMSNLYAFDASSIGGEIRNYKNLVLYMIDPLVD